MNTMEQQINAQALMDAALKVIANPPDNILGSQIVSIKAKHSLGRKLIAMKPIDERRTVISALALKRMGDLISATMDLLNMSQICEEQGMEFPDLVTLLSEEPNL